MTAPAARCRHHMFLKQGAHCDSCPATLNEVLTEIRMDATELTLLKRKLDGIEEPDPPDAQNLLQRIVEVERMGISVRPYAVIRELNQRIMEDSLLLTCLWEQGIGEKLEFDDAVEENRRALAAAMRRAPGRGEA